MTINKMLRQSGAAGTKSRASASVNAEVENGVSINHHFHVECFDRDGKLKWDDHFDNLVVDEGLDDYLEQYYNGSTYTASHFVMLTDGTPSVAAGDSMSSHVGWVEIEDYSEGTRQAYSPAAVSGQSVTNTASKAVFSINGTATVGGAAITTNNTKGGTTGTLVGGNAFTGGDRSLANGDTLNVTVVASLTSS
jgi:hypothetical protein